MIQTAELVTSARCRLTPLDGVTARALLAGAPAGVKPGPGWPHADSLTAIRAAVELGWPSWLVELRSTGEVIGECGLKGWADVAGSVEIGYGLAGPARGHGYGREAVGALLDWLVRRRLARRVLAEVAAGNTASRRLVEALGFSETETRHGFVYYAKDLPEPPAAPASPDPSGP
jgi:RimJ/RimL family protein N-acetyltransferase